MAIFWQLRMDYVVFLLNAFSTESKSLIVLPEGAPRFVIKLFINSFSSNYTPNVVLIFFEYTYDIVVLFI